MQISGELPIESETGVRAVGGLLPLMLAVASMLVLNGCLILAGVRQGVRYENRLLQAKWQLAGDTSRTFDWIVLGDSSGTFGVDPEVLSEHLPGEAINLCTFGGMGLTGDLWMLDHYLATHPPPRGVILVHAADVWTGGHGEPFYQYTAAIPEPTSKLMLRLAPLRPQPSHWMTLLEYRDYFPVLLLKDRLRTRIGWQSDAGDQDSPPVDLPPSGRLRLTRDQANPDRVVELCKTYWSPDRASGRRVVNWRARRALRGIHTRTSELHVPLLVANGPIAACVRERGEYAHRFAKLRADLDSLTADRSMHRVFADWRAFSPDDMENCNHIAGPAVDAYTQELAAAIIAIIGR